MAVRRIEDDDVAGSSALISTWAEFDVFTLEAGTKPGIVAFDPNREHAVHRIVRLLDPPTDAVRDDVVVAFALGDLIEAMNSVVVTGSKAEPVSGSFAYHSSVHEVSQRLDVRVNGRRAKASQHCLEVTSVFGPLLQGDDEHFDMDQ